MKDSNGVNPPMTREFSRSKRERVWRYYSKVISYTLSALDDGSLSKLPCREYIEYVLSALGFDAEEWTRLHDEELIKQNITALRVDDDTAIDRAINRMQRQRERLNAWQAAPGNPILIEHRAVFEKDEQHSHSEYRIPIGSLLREIIAACPVGTNYQTLRAACNRRVADYLKCYAGSAKITSRKREHSPESDANRAATVALSSFNRELEKHGEVAAAALVHTAFRTKLGDFFTKIFGEIGFCRKCKQAIDLDGNVSTTNVRYENEVNDNTDSDLDQIPINRKKGEGEWIN